MRPYSEIVPWDEVKESVARLNRDFFELVEEINPKDLPIHFVRYPYGEIISTDKTFYFPKDDGTLKPLDVSEFPYVFVLDKNLEIFAETADEVIPRQVYSPGSFFPYNTDINISGALSPAPKSIFTLTSGLRNISILPIFQSSLPFTELLHSYDLDPTLEPNNAKTHYKIFKAVADATEHHWCCELLMFGDVWKENIINNPKWTKLKIFLLEQSIRKNAYKRNISFLDHAIKDIISDNRMSIRNYTVEAIKTILLAALGDYPGFKPATDDTGLPLECFCREFESSYSPGYVPIVVEPVVQEPGYDKSPIYHSLSINLSVDRLSRAKPQSYIPEIRDYMDIFLDGFTKHLMTKTSAYGQLKNILEYNLYTERGDSSGAIRQFESLLDDDSRFLTLLNGNRNGLHKRSLFSKALVSLRYNKNILDLI